MKKQDAGLSGLPHELIDAIVDENQDDRATLRACSLVNHSWTYSSQRHIFSRVSFNNKRTNYFIQRRSQRTIEQFYALICAQPRIATFVQAVEISPLLDVQLLARILEKLTRLESISVDLCEYRWDELSLYLRDTLAATLRSPRITNLELREGQFLHCTDFLALLGGSGHLKQLTLSGVSCGSFSDSQIRAKNTSGLKLKSLAISLYEHSHFPLLRLLQSSVNLSSLHRLAVLTAGTGHPGERVGITKEFLRRLNGSLLKQLVLNVCLGEPLSNLIDVSQLRSIRIKLWWMRLDQHTRPSEWLRWMSAIFRELVQWHTVEEVTFEIFYASDFTMYIDEWVALDAVLGRLQSLRKVHLRLDKYDGARARWRHAREYPGSLEDDAKGVLPTLAQKKILFVEVAANFPC
ncbi:uncharacterized protein EV420DRAFT_142263 [Desarmillaria tabescens]|uniref:Uncharacterized protein n=1 Tax=Armillaria tabescens TaxID=1929756 RepID=A0AA39TS75_ARMTA|nr:uncharacterized protein EV420DRAFT_142263 [Desarmillaria tabescens]KAK0462029.1 hypothetical protein EV420DRAFT_142263 [Desarmillaria tabescens]